MKDVIMEAKSKGTPVRVAAAEKAVEELLQDEPFTEEDYERCRKYVTVLNLRNWAKLDGNAVTEQIYVHSKIMIVDDLFAIIGSANVNDRSLTGTRDSELALLVVGEPDGEGHRRFARNFRERLWRKMLGVAKGSEPGQGITEGEFLALFNSPMSYEKCAKKLQEIGDKNAEIYEKVFRHVPRNYYKKETEIAARDEEEEKDFSSIYPTLNIFEKK